MLSTVIAITLLPFAVLAIKDAFAEDMEAIREARIRRQETKRKEDEAYVEDDITNAR